MSQEYVVNVIAHVDHGKTTFMDSVLAESGRIAKSSVGDARILDSRKDELERGMTMKISPVTISGPPKITFLDTPGHLEFGSLAESSFIIADTSLVIVDISAGATDRTKFLVETAKKAGTRVILLINKIDALFKRGVPQDEAEYLAEMVLQSLEAEQAWENGDVLLGSARDGWGISIHTNPTQLLGRPTKHTLSLNKALALIKAVYSADSAGLNTLSTRLGLVARPGRKATFTARDVLSTAFGLFPAVQGLITSQASTWAAANCPPEVLGVICANTLVGETLTAVTRLSPHATITPGMSVKLIEATPNPTTPTTPTNPSSILPSTPGTIQQIILFEEALPSPATPTDTSLIYSGLVGIQGLPCKKRGLLVTECSPAVLQFAAALPWPVFNPIFVDIIVTTPESFPEVFRRIGLLSRCDPGLFCAINRDQEIVVKSDGSLQIDKIKTDLEGLEYSVRESSGIHLETLEYATGTLAHNNLYYPATIQGLASRSTTTTQPLCTTHYDPAVPPELRAAASALLKRGPYLACPIGLVKLTISAPLPSPPSPPTTLQTIFLSGQPRLLTNHTHLLVRTLSTQAKSVLTAVSQTPASITATDSEPPGLRFQIRTPVHELRHLAVLIRDHTKAAADLYTHPEVFYALLDSPTYEAQLVHQIRLENGLHEPDKVA
ncbi:hypothetical protein NEHOM01_1551 [Nematocida homosporus]|uniref:uncharacterized protein n=1 Tax=Nematocida homosporus TaxID=1912981 RepID=UPI002220ECFE|nr:uncharacterized protein NEHOM01_1551 [Nematocida homosporus]KAI5186565.1 hypothetical protein NEHOM01_1551 [Nematocida homosporus]